MLSKEGGSFGPAGLEEERALRLFCQGDDGLQPVLLWQSVQGLCLLRSSRLKQVGG